MDTCLGHAELKLGPRVRAVTLVGLNLSKEGWRKAVSPCLGAHTSVYGQCPYGKLALAGFTELLFYVQAACHQTVTQRPWQEESPCQVFMV